MSQHTIAAPQASAKCDPAVSVTKSLLAYGVLAGPTYVVVSLAQALTRDGFDPTRHAWSLLANGGLGWIQMANLIVTGIMTGAFAAGLRRARTAGWSHKGWSQKGWSQKSVWAPRLFTAYAVSLVAAGIFRADPALGFPPGTPDGPGQITWHGILHFVAAGVGFACLIAACFVVARRFASEGRRGWAWYSRGTGVAFLAAFVGLAAGAGSAALNVAFTAAIILVWAWVSALAIHLYRRAATN